MKSFHQPRDLFREFVSCLSQEGESPANLMKLNNLMKKLLFLGAFAFFALTVSAQSTEAPADNKAKTEQTCSKDAQKASCSKDKAAGCCSKSGASADAKGATCSRRTSLLDAHQKSGASADAKGATCKPEGQVCRLLLQRHRRRPAEGTKGKSKKKRGTRPLACPRASDSCNTEFRKGCPWGGPFFVHGVAGEASTTQLCTIQARKRSVPWMWVP